jgi:adenylate cyclase
VRDQRQQAIAIGKLAIDMLRALDGLPALGGNRLPLRIGIHTGSATAGIIGDTRFSYEVWGDAVNMASRMESHGLPNSIQVSEAFRDAVAGTFRFHARGIVEIRSLGQTRTYLLDETS